MFRNQIINSLSKVTGVGEKNIHLEIPADPAHGDYAANIAMVLAKSKNADPLKLANQIKETLSKDENLSSCISKIEVVRPGFVNFFLSPRALEDNLTQILKEKSNYGKSDIGKDKTWLLEHTSPNPNKAMHLGHLRNNVTAMAIGNLWEAIGIKVIRDAVDNNRGIAIARLMYGYLKYARKSKDTPVDLDYWYDQPDKWYTPEEKQIRPDKFVDELYTKGSKDFKEDQQVEEIVRQMVMDWEAEDKKNWALWKKVLEYSHQGQALTLKRLANKWDHVWHEHEHYKEGKAMVTQGLRDGIFHKGKGGAIVTNLKKYNLPDTVLIKSDGAALYLTQDIALTKLKKEKFSPNKMFWVIGPEQSLQLKQLFAVSEQLNIGKYNDFIHLAYGWMSIKGQGKMSSRLGNVIYIDNLIDLAKDRIKKIMDSENFDKNETEKTAEQIALGAIKYSILKIHRLKDTAFDISESVALEGNSGPYLQYTFARTQSVLRKAAKRHSGLASESILNQVQNNKSSLNQEELTIFRKLVHFSEIVVDSAEAYAPNLLCNYLYELAQIYNSFYNAHKIIDSENQDLRLALTFATGQLLQTGLNLLGIQAPKRM